MHQVLLTANFERNLASIEFFLQEAQVSHAYDALLDQLSDTVIPNLERFPDMGKAFLEDAIGSVEVNVKIEALQRQMQDFGGNFVLRKYVLTDYLLLYARSDVAIYLLSIRHHRQVSFQIAV